MLHNQADALGIVFDELDQSDFFQLPQVSTAWNNIFNHSANWKKRIAKDFHIKEEILNQFPPEVVFADKKFYQNIYKRLYAFINQSNHANLLKFKRILHDKEKHFILIACCSDNPNYLFEVMFKEERELCVKIALYAKCNEILKKFLPEDSKALSLFLENVIETGNLEMAKYILELSVSRNYEINFSQFLCNKGTGLIKSALSGHIDIFAYFCELTINPQYQEVLRFAAKSGSVKLVSFILDTKNKFNVYLDKETLLAALESGNMKLISYLFALNNEGDVRIILSSENIAEAVPLSGNVKVISFLENKKLDWKSAFKPCNGILKSIETSGCLNMIDGLFDVHKSKTLLAEDYFKHEYLRKAVVTANKELILYSINPMNGLNLQLNPSHLESAIECGNIESVLFLLDPRNNFELELKNNAWKLIFNNTVTFENIMFYICMYLTKKMIVENNDHTIFETENWKAGIANLENNLSMPINALDNILDNINCIQSLLIAHAYMELTVKHVLSKNKLDEKDNQAFDSALSVNYKLSPTHFYHYVDYFLNHKKFNQDVIQFVHAFVNEKQTLQKNKRHFYLVPPKPECLSENINSLRL